MNRPLLAFSLATAALLPGTSFAAGPPPAWQVNEAASQLNFAASMSGQAIPGRFRRWNAQIRFDPANLPASQVMAVIETGSAATGDRTRDEALPTADWFNAAAFPRATFRSRRIAAAGPGRYTAYGDLTIRGVSRPVALPFTLAITRDVARMQGSLMINRALFGVGQGQWKSGSAVALNVRVNISLVARRMAAR